MTCHRLHEQEHNRPYNSQMVVDHLAHEGFKKSQVVKALESLTEAKKVHYKVTSVAVQGRMLAVPRCLRIRQMLYNSTIQHNMHCVGVRQDCEDLCGAAEQQDTAERRGASWHAWPPFAGNASPLPAECTDGK